MPKFKLDVNQTIYFEEQIIEAKDEEEAIEKFREAEANGFVEVADSDAMDFTLVEEVSEDTEVTLTEEQCKEE